ncbi:DMT family transporter [Frankia sp. CNm7]|uniref:DMT family transporter n=1 Tax=Frankia nepalensis TaxID=1836974 RepID=A0A937RJ62_9ACTN|nr:DMT family transporter [Frankia nepalensis]MBL7495696.1 DMT family transporter [Frankia nepalensis]MBL7511377.1 DMT family transporter [Frankia nepalensis]MBL7521458.1 DMT family transporter [Frankia nepalensis]MBL7631147.1 DMT family transporter [Frankia nepalensis]
MSRRGWALFAAMSLIWGIPYLLIKVAVDEVSGPVIVLARTVVGALVLLPIALRDRPGLAQVRRHWRPILAFATIEILGPWILLSDAERHLSSSLTGLLVAAVPVIAIVSTRLTGGAERITAARGLGLAVGTGGVAVLAVPGIDGFGAWPVLEVLAVAVCYAVAPLIVTRRLGDVPSLPMTAACLAFAAVVYTGPAAVTWPSTVPSARVLGALITLGLVCTALAFVLFFALIREVGNARATVITFVNPAVAIAAGAVFLSEPLTWFIGVGFALILAGSVLATSSPRPAATEPSLTVPSVLSAAPVPATSVPTTPVTPPGRRAGARGWAMSRHRPAR